MSDLKNFSNNIPVNSKRVIVRLDLNVPIKKSKVDDAVEFYSTIRTQKIIQECDVALVLIDAEKGLGSQDKAVIRAVTSMGKGMVLVVNKWDKIQKNDHTMKDYAEDLMHDFKAVK